MGHEPLGPHILYYVQGKHGLGFWLVAVRDGEFFITKDLNAPDPIEFVSEAGVQKERDAGWEVVIYDSLPIPPPQLDDGIACDLTLGQSGQSMPPFWRSPSLEQRLTPLFFFKASTK